MSMSDSVDIYELRYTKADLMTVPDRDRIFYLLATGLMNDIQVLIRQYIIAIKQRDEDKVRRDASSAVAMLNLRLLAGRFHEGWILIKEEWPALEASYIRELSKRGIDALASLRGHFTVAKGSNIVFMIRNKIGFHSDVGFARKMLAAVPNDTELVDYLSVQLGDTLYFGSEVLHYQALQEITAQPDSMSAFGAVMDELRKLQNLFLDFISAFVKVFAHRHLPRQFASTPSQKHTLERLAKFEKLQIPYFIDFSKGSPEEENSKS